MPQGAPRKGTPAFQHGIRILVRRLKVDAFTARGLRSAFRDWAGDATHFPHDVAEQALAHRVGDSAERAYRLADALDRIK